MEIKELLCPSCGGKLTLSVDLSIGVCQSCGLNSAIVKNKTLIDHSEEAKLLIDEGFDMILRRKFISAEKVFNKALDYDPRLGKAYFGLLLCYLSVRDINELAEQKNSYKNNEYYLRAIKFLPEEEKNALIFLCQENEKRRNK